MKIISLENNQCILRFNKNEELITSFTEFCKNHKIRAAFFSAIGSASEVNLSYYNQESTAYEDHLISENMEIVNVSGNIALLENKLIIHAHGIFAKKDLSTIGGHIKSLIISATCEVFLTKLTEDLLREYDESTGLKLLKANS